MSVNRVLLLGHLGSDPEIIYTPAGAALTKFTLATRESWKDKSGAKQERTEWHKIVVWGTLAVTCMDHLKKGRQAFIEGSLNTRSYQDKDGATKYTTEVKAQVVQFIGGPDPGAEMPQDNSDLPF